jgi:hypothetical protein
MLIEITKRTGGSATLRCKRADGSIAWQKQDGPNARFFPLHDLTHYAVETVLRSTHGFFGLIADGWEIDDTTGKGARGPLPDEALAIEQIVGILDAERASDTALSASEFNKYSAEYAALHGTPPPNTLTDEQLGRVRSLRDEMHQRWFLLAPGETVELSF